MKTDRLIVVARMIGTYGIILEYFVTLHISTLFGAMLNVIFELLALPFYVKNKMWDVVICFSFLISIGISKIIMGFDPQFQFMKIAMGLT